MRTESKGPYQVKEFLVVDDDNTIIWRCDWQDKRIADGVCQCMNSAYLAGQQSQPPSYVMSTDYEALWEALKTQEVVVFMTILKIEHWSRANASSLGCPRGQEACFKEWSAVNLEWIAPLPPSKPEVNPNDDEWAANMRLKSKTALINIIRSERRDSNEPTVLPFSEREMVELGHKKYGIPENASNDWCHNHESALDKNSGFIDALRYANTKAVYLQKCGHCGKPCRPA